MRAIDWSRAPVDATHACPGAYDYPWRKKDGDSWYMWYHRGWQRVVPSPELYQLRPNDRAERNKACDEMFGVALSLPEDRRHNRSDIVEALYDAGYRKFEIVDGEA